MATTRYVWEKWNYATVQKYVGKITNGYWILRSNGSLSFRPNLYVDPNSGKVTLSGNSGDTGWGAAYESEYDYRHCSQQYFDAGVDDEFLYTPSVHIFDQKLKVVQEAVYVKGSDSYGNVSSTSANAYTSNGKVGEYWYISKGSDNIDPSSLTYSDAVTAGQNVTLTIAPSTGTTLGGNISYVVQTTTNGTDWYDAGETSETSYTVTVPADAIVWNVRVYAKDDTGFTSSTYIYGNGVTTYVNVIRVGVAPDSGDIGYITSPQVMFVSVNTDTDYTFTVKLDDETLSSSSSSSSSTIRHIILSEEKFNSLKEETKYTLTVEIVQNGATITRTYTFQKFVYDDTTLGGVFSGAAKALRIKRKIQSQIVGANIPKEIIKIDNPIGVSDLAAATASEAEVLNGYTFFSGDNELKTGNFPGGYKNCITGSKFVTAGYGTHDSPASVKISTPTEAQLIVVCTAGSSNQGLNNGIFNSIGSTDDSRRMSGSAVYLKSTINTWGSTLYSMGIGYKIASVDSTGFTINYCTLNSNYSTSATLVYAYFY